MAAISTFISYRMPDRDAALRIYNELTANGISAWIDVENLLPGANVDATIRRAIAESRYFLAIISRNSVDKKGYMFGEVAQALHHLEQYAETEVYLIPVRLDDTVPTSHEILRKHAWLDLFPDWNRGMQRLLKTLLQDHE
jgi:hypothetical protein